VTVTSWLQAHAHKTNIAEPAAMSVALVIRISFAFLSSQEKSPGGHLG
jgi:hypothetical protein